MRFTLFTILLVSIAAVSALPVPGESSTGVTSVGGRQDSHVANTLVRRAETVEQLRAKINGFRETYNFNVGLKPQHETILANAVAARTAAINAGRAATTQNARAAADKALTKANDDVRTAQGGVDRVQRRIDSAKRDFDESKQRMQRLFGEVVASL